MAGTEAVETRRVTEADLPAPDRSALDPGPRTFELIFVDDGSTDGIISPRTHPDGDWADCGLPPIRGISTNVQGAPHRSANS
jgi:hypothetical protein